MKTKLSPFRLWTQLRLMLILALCPAPCALSQIPQGFNYQAIVRDGSNEILANKNMTITIALHANSETGALLWEETHAVTSDQFGLISLVVGKGTPTGGLPLFTDIDWSTQTVFLETTVEYPVGTTTPMGTTQIWAVPYSLVAKDVEGPIEKLGISGTTEEMDEALFEVRNNDGQIIFAVYNQGVRIYVDDAAKGPKGGFAIGGFGTDKGTSQPYFIVKPDTVRVYINKSGKGPKGGFAIGGYGTDKADIQDFLFISDDSVRIYVDNADTDLKGVKGGFAIGGYGTAKGKPQDLFTVSNDSVRIYLDKAATDKGPKGGFAIGGYGTTKAIEEEYLRVTRDSTRINVNNNPAKGVKGGFAIGGFGETKGSITPFTSLTDENYFIGHRSGVRNTTGIHNSYVGYEAGQNNTEGRKNVFLGYHSGYLNDTASYNVFIGNEAGLNNMFGRFNSFLGFQAGYNNMTSFNSFIGYQAGWSTNSGTSNVFLGYKTGYTNQGGSNNVAVGNVAGYGGTGGTSNVFIGDSAGYGNTSSYNVFLGKGSGKVNTALYNSFLGYQAGFKNTSGSSNVFIGNQSGYNNIGGSYNVSVGHKAGFSSNTSYNTFVGYQAGYSITTGQQNVFLGYNSGYSNTTSWSNVFLGTNSGYNNTTGSTNVFIGEHAGYSNQDGISNVFIGWYAGEKNLGNNGQPMPPQLGDYNIFVGNNAGRNNTIGYHNIFMGMGAGEGNITGQENVFLGNNAGHIADDDWNVFVGIAAGYLHTSGVNNTFLGHRAGFTDATGTSNTYTGAHAGESATGSYNSFFGASAGLTSGSGHHNAFLGYNAGYYNSTGSFNTFVGGTAGSNNGIGGSNTFVGYGSGVQTNGTTGMEGSLNTYVGTGSGGSNVTGRNNVFLGYSAGSSELSSYKLYIESSNSSTPLIYGEFDNDILTFHAKVGIGTKTPSEKLEITGSDSKIFLNSSSSNMILYNISGSAAPAFNSRSTGTKLVLNPQVAPSSADYALGIETNALWYSVPQATSDFSHKFYAGTAEVMRIRGDGRIGIGVASPTETLEIGGTNSKIYLNSSSSNMMLYNISGSAAPAFSTRSAGSKLVLNPQVAPSSADYALGIESNALWYSVPQATSSFSHKFYAGTTELMRIQGNGRVGIGTTDPAYTLDVGGIIKTTDKFISGANGAAFLQGGDDSELRDVNVVNTLAIYGIQDPTKATLRLGSNSADISGYNSNIGIGTTTPAHKLDVAGTANIQDFLILESETINVTTTTGFIVVPSNSNVLLTASASSTLNTTTPIANGTTIGQLLILRGASLTNPVTVPDAGNVNLAGNRILHYQDNLTLIWDGTSWTQIAFADNTP